MKILHVSPTYFDRESVIGGGERYAFELAKAMANKEEVVFSTFAGQPISHQDGPLHIEHLSKARHMSLFREGASWLTFLKWIRWADIVHCHQVFTRVTDFALIFGKLLGKKVFLTDLGGSDRFALSYHFPLLRCADALLLISAYSRKLWERSPRRCAPHKVEVIYGGTDPRQFSPGNGRKSDSILFVGRILPHKGIDYLIDAVDGSFTLDVVGPVYHKEYLELLRSKSQHKAVRFHNTCDDAELVQKYREALVTVQPSVYESCYGEKTAIPELLGLTALESMACGTPVIVTEVASLPEIVKDGVNGFVVPPNSPAAIREKIDYLRANPTEASEMGKRGRETVLKRFTWEIVADRCLAAYESNQS